MKKIRTTKKLSLRFQTLEAIRVSIHENFKNNKKNLLSELISNDEYMGSLKITDRFNNNFRFLKDSDKSFFEKLKELSYKISDFRQKELSKQIFGNEEIYKKICLKSDNYYPTIRELYYNLGSGRIVDLATKLINPSIKDEKEIVIKSEKGKNRPDNIPGYIFVRSEVTGDNTFYFYQKDYKDYNRAIAFFGNNINQETVLLLIELCKINPHPLEKEDIVLELYFNSFTKLFTFKKTDMDPKLNCIVGNLFIGEIKLDYNEIKSFHSLTIEEIKSAFIDKVEGLINLQYKKLLEQSLSEETEINYKIKDLKRIISVAHKDTVSNLLEKELPIDEIKKLNYVEIKEFLSILEEILL